MAKEETNFWIEKIVNGRTVKDIDLISDEEIEYLFFKKIGQRNTLTEKEFLIGLIMAKIVRDKWFDSLTKEGDSSGGT